MNIEKNKLPMAGDSPGKRCCSGTNQTGYYELAAGTNWICGLHNTTVGQVYRVATCRDRCDIKDNLKVRWSMFRMNYAIPPGLYAVGNPDEKSAVLVSANYKLSFDCLRRELTGFNLWILVLDTKGINVWCAAGKGSFGTAELARMVEATSLRELVSHRTLILPQLAAPGVAAHEVYRTCDFKVKYGPVRAAELPAYLRDGCKAEPEMRHPRFAMQDRLILTPIELTATLKPVLGLTMFFFLLNLISQLIRGNGISWIALPLETAADLIPYLIAFLIGTVCLPLMLPYIPGRAFSWKGCLLGLLWVAIYTTVALSPADWLKISALFLTIPAITAFLGMNFTGSSTYTSLSGVVKEMGIALPLIIVSAALGLAALVAVYFC